MAKVLLFGELRSVAGSNELSIEAQDLDELKQKLFDQRPGLRNKVFTTAVNKVMQNSNVSLNDQDEVAIMPPFSGG